MDLRAMDLKGLLEVLTGEPLPFPTSHLCESVQENINAAGLGYSQMNELLLLAGYNRIEKAFFQYLVNGSSDYQQNSELRSLGELANGVERFLKHAIYRFGNVKYAFEYMSTLGANELEAEISVVNPVEIDSQYVSRHEPIRPIEPIAGEETYYLGYLIERQLKEKLAKSPNDPDAQREVAKRDSLIKKGIHNHEAYLASDHMDVYVATSMRERHEYYFVNNWTKKIFEDDRLRRLKLRYFDPTQAYCHDRIDKGLSEALMLKRAKCTLYFAQETDTLGKDSELASTLAQGKTVIAFVPEIPEKDKEASAFLKTLVDTAKRLYPERDQRELVLQQLQVFDSGAAWTDETVRGWIANPTTMDLETAQKRLMEVIRRHYDRRAKMLKEDHPLGVQVHLETGVANGVLVARTFKQCAEVIHRAVTNRLEFNITSKMIEDKRYVFLRESVTDSVFRVVTGDAMLRNAFWNFYLPR